MGKTKRGGRSEVRRKEREERGRDRSRERQRVNAEREIQEIRENLVAKLGPQKVEPKPEVTPEVVEKTDENEYAFIDYGDDGDGGTDAKHGDVDEPAHAENGAAGAGSGELADPEHRAGESVGGKRRGDNRASRSSPSARARGKLRRRRR